MLIDKTQLLNYLQIKKGAYERVRATLQADVVQECINEVNTLPEVYPDFYLVDERGKVHGND